MAFSAPISVRCSSTIRVMVVRQANAATRKKITGKMVARLLTRSVSWAKLTKPTLVFRPRMYHWHSSTWSSSSRASSSFCWASAIFPSASAFPSSYSLRPPAYSASPSSSLSRASASSRSPSSWASSACPLR